MKLEQNDKTLLFSETVIPDVFFSDYLSQIPGDYLKIYLYIIFLSKYKKDVKLNDLSKKLNIPLKTISEGLKFLEENKLITKKSTGYIIIDLQEATLHELYTPNLTISKEKVAYLTFDDGPSANTQKILEILDRYNVKATFFVTGNNQAYNHLIKAAHDKGHTIALHTYCHDYPKIYASTSAYFDDLTKVGNMVKDLIGHVPKYVRFPGGASNTVSRKYCPGIMSVLSKELIARGYQYYDWNVDSTDASGNNVPVSKIVANATNSNANNINILFHDTAAKSTTVQALPAIIENYLSRGYRFEAINDSSFVPHQKVNN